MRYFCHIAAVCLLALSGACGDATEEADDPTVAMASGSAAGEGNVAPGQAASGAPGEIGQTAGAQGAGMEPPAAWAQCAVCHSARADEHGIGPSLAGVFNRRAASLPGYVYSPAMRSANLTWDQPTLNRYLADPQGVVPGTRMALPGIDQDSRTAVIAYLKTL